MDAIIATAAEEIAFDAALANEADFAAFLAAI